MRASSTAMTRGPGGPVTRFWRWLAHREWEIGRGIDIDMDGGVEGSGFLLRIEPPRWLRRWASRRLPPPTEQEVFLHRQDISDVLLGSLLTRANLLGLTFEQVERSKKGYAPGVQDELEYHFQNRVSQAITHTWTEDQLNPTEDVDAS